MKRRNPVFLTLFLLLAFINVSRACTTFVLKDGETLLFGRNLDSDIGRGLLVVNQRGIGKAAFIAPTMKPARWVAKYGSVTFNQFGRELPFGGMNEAGLVVETMLLPESEYAPADDRAGIGTGQWVQYQLDNCRSVDEVLATDKTIRIASGPGEKFKIHYLVCDASGDTAAFEFLDGKMICHRGDALPSKALTNDTYDNSVAFLDNGDELEGKKKRRSLNRFAQASQCVKEFQSSSAGDDLDYAFQVLRQVSLGKFTVWNVVYDIPNRKVCYRTQENEHLRQLSFDDCDFVPEGPPAFVDVNASGEGDVAPQFSPLTEESHKNYLLDFYGSDEFKKFMGGDGTRMVPMYLKSLRTYQPK